MGDKKNKTVKNAHISHNSGNNEWYTPKEYIEVARKTMGTIDVDPASSEKANETVKAKIFYTKEIEGLTKVWKGNIWLNPPYSQPLIEQFTSTLANKLGSKEVKQAILLVNNATETKWFQKMAKSCDAVCFPTRRIRFLDPKGNPGAPLQGQVVLYFGDNPCNFEEHFIKFGPTLWKI